MIRSGNLYPHHTTQMVRRFLSNKVTIKREKPAAYKRGVICRSDQFLSAFKPYAKRTRMTSRPYVSRQNEHKDRDHGRLCQFSHFVSLMWKFDTTKTKFTYWVGSLDNRNRQKEDQIRASRMWLATSTLFSVDGKMTCQLSVQCMTRLHFERDMNPFYQKSTVISFDVKKVEDDLK